MTTWLHEQRLEVVLAVFRSSGAETVLDLGCGDGALLTRLIREPNIRRIVGIDLSAEALHRLRVKLREEPPAIRCKVELFHGSLMEPRESLAGFDAAILFETIEHIDPDRLSLVERAVFRELRPAMAIVTTPNSDFNALLGVPSSRFRHPDHRFEWGRIKFRTWADGVAGRNGYGVTFEDVPDIMHPACGGPTQMGVFRRHVKSML
jgi:3' terminal RNA ribose 2'-O-methyltransferase Hen1